MHNKTINLLLISILISLIIVTGLLSWAIIQKGTSHQSSKEKGIDSSLAANDANETEEDGMEIEDLTDEQTEDFLDEDEVAESMRDEENNKFSDADKIEPIVDKGVWYQGEYYISAGDLPKPRANASRSELQAYESALHHFSLLWGEPIRFEGLTRIINIPDAPDLTMEFFSTDLIEYDLKQLGKAADVHFLFTNLSDDFNIDVTVHELYVDGQYMEDPYYYLRADIGHGDMEATKIHVSSTSLFADEPLQHFPEFAESIVGQFHITYKRVINDPNIKLPDSIRIPFVIDLRTL